MKRIFILMIFVLFFISLSCVCASGNYTALQNEIDNSGNYLELNQDYAYDKSCDTDRYCINIDKENFTLNGNGHTISGNNVTVFEIASKNVTITNLCIADAHSFLQGAAISSMDGVLTISNVTFINNTADQYGGAILTGGYLNLSNVRFINNYGESGGGDIYLQNGAADIYNCSFTNDKGISKAMIMGNGDSTLNADSCVFYNTTSKYATAILNVKKTNIRNSIFRNLFANETGGAIVMKTYDSFDIQNCTFTNVSSLKDGGVIFIDTYFDIGDFPIVRISNSSFRNSFSGFGGVILILNGDVRFNNNVFANNSASYDGGVIYSSLGILTVENNTFISNNALSGNGGAIYCFDSTTVISNSNFTNNQAGLDGDAIYNYDSKLTCSNSTFKNNGIAVFDVYGRKISLENNVLINDTLSLNNTDYDSYIFEEGIPIKIIDNIIDVSGLPSKFDSRDWGWVTPVKNQGVMGSCWAFSACGAVESALLKFTGVPYIISENNMQNIMLRYSKYGSDCIAEGGHPYIAIQYMLSWLGVLSSDDDVYDEYGKISPVMVDDNIHVQDIICVPSSRDPFEYMDEIKKAIMECGAVTSSFTTDSASYDSSYASYYNDVDRRGNHAITVIGWDDNFPKENFMTEAPGNGAWICKNSWGTEWGKDGFFYISYYDKSFNREDTIFGVIFENNITYNKNYQTDFGGKVEYDTNILKYYNNYISKGNDFLAAVGTFFKTEGINYTLDIYVNNQLKLSQNGTSRHSGFSTIRLDENVQLHENDNFTVFVTGNYAPLIKNSVHKFQENTSFAYFDGKMNDLALRKLTNCLKAYTIENPILSHDLVKIYKNDSAFEVNVGKANQTVTFVLNGVSYKRTADENGTARMAINLAPGNYTITTIFNGTSVENTIEVLPTLIADNLVKYFRNGSQFLVSLVGGEGNLLSGKNITMNINGVFYTRTTNENGTAKLNINLAPGEYILTATDPLTGLQMSYNITVLPILTANDLNMSYKDGSKFTAKLVDGQGNAYANQSVTFNVNGVFYNRMTDANGEAKLNINLMAGEYIITSSYNGANAANKITISS